mmetsp:Transcript_6488/g.19235  ORF Transcript_6488/g.19235 Transcript_6488/m.19235 type:complete len:379 (-) Transcript_6488:205-1341(-)
MSTPQLFGFREREPKLDVRVMTGLSGASCTISASRSWTFSDLKLAIASEFAILVEEIKFAVGACVVRNDARLVSLAGDGDAGLDVTMLRRRPLKLCRDASPAEWYALYVYEHDKHPPDPTQLVMFAASRGGQVTYRAAVQVLAVHADAAVPLADLPMPEEAAAVPQSAPARPPAEETAASPPVPAALGKKAARSVFENNPRPQFADASISHCGVRGDTASCTAMYVAVGGFRTDEQCPICLMSEVGPGRDIVELTCEGAHRVHQSCIERWFMGGASGVPQANEGAGWAWADPALRWDPLSRPGQDTTGYARLDCPMCRGWCEGQVAVKPSGVFVSPAGCTVADASSRGKQAEPSLVKSCGVFVKAAGPTAADASSRGR